MWFWYLQISLTVLQKRKPPIINGLSNSKLVFISATWIEYGGWGTNPFYLFAKLIIHKLSTFSICIIIGCIDKFENENQNLILKYKMVSCRLPFLFYFDTNFWYHARKITSSKYIQFYKKPGLSYPNYSKKFWNKQEKTKVYSKLPLSCEKWKREIPTWYFL